MCRGDVGGGGSCGDNGWASSAPTVELSLLFGDELRLLSLDAIEFADLFYDLMCACVCVCLYR